MSFWFSQSGIATNRIGIYQHPTPLTTMPGEKPPGAVCPICLRPDHQASACFRKKHPCVVCGQVGHSKATCTDHTRYNRTLGAVRNEVDLRRAFRLIPNSQDAQWALNTIVAEYNCDKEAESKAAASKVAADKGAASKAAADKGEAKPSRKRSFWESSGDRAWDAQIRPLPRRNAGMPVIRATRSPTRKRKAPDGDAESHPSKKARKEEEGAAKKKEPSKEVRSGHTG